MKKSSFSRKYTKYIVKNPIVFYGALILSIALFLYLTSTTLIETDSGAESLLRIIVTRAGRGL